MPHAAGEEFTLPGGGTAKRMPKDLPPPRERRYGVTCWDLADWELHVAGGVTIMCLYCPKKVCPTCNRTLDPIEYEDCDICGNDRSLILIKDVKGNTTLTTARKHFADEEMRAIALSIALTEETIISPDTLLRYFSPERYMVKITPIHETAASHRNNIHTPGGYQEFTPYRKLEETLRQCGYDVIVFIPSIEEDEGLITCGNAILSGSLPGTEWKEIPSQDS